MQYFISDLSTCKHEAAFIRICCFEAHAKKDDKRVENIKVLSFQRQSFRLLSFRLVKDSVF